MEENIVTSWGRSSLCVIMYFEIIGAIVDKQRIAAGTSIREIARLRKQHGAGRWRKLKGVATVRLGNGRIRRLY